MRRRTLLVCLKLPCLIGRKQPPPLPEKIMMIKFPSFQGARHEQSEAKHELPVEPSQSNEAVAEAKTEALPSLLDESKIDTAATQLEPLEDPHQLLTGVLQRERGCMAFGE